MQNANTCLYFKVPTCCNAGVPKLSQFTTPLVSQQFFYGTPRPKEIPNTSIYSVVRSKQFTTAASHSSLTVVTFCNLEICVSLENMKHPAVHSLGIGDVISLSVLTQLYFFVAIIILTGLCYMFGQYTIPLH